MSSITGLGLRNKVGLGKPKDPPSKPKQQGSSITGLGLRNKAAGLAGNRKDPDQASRDHVVTPRSALIDPASFAPPPKNVNFHGTAEEGRQVRGVPQKGPIAPAEYRAREEDRAKREREQAANEKEQRRLDREMKQSRRLEQQGEEDPPETYLRYNKDTTGLSTTQFEPPIARSAAVDGSIVIRSPAPSNPKPTPPLPPRLPERQNSGLNTRNLSSTSTYGTTEYSLPGQASKRSLNSVGIPTEGTPGFRTNSDKLPSNEYETRPQLPTRLASLAVADGRENASGSPQLSELQSRFARMSTASLKAEAPSQGMMRSKGAALRTASSQNDPACGSILKGRDSSSTWGDFREQSANTSNQNLESSNNTALYNGPATKNLQPHQEVDSPTNVRDRTMLPSKKSPPVKPRKRAELSGVTINASDNSPSQSSG